MRAHAVRDTVQGLYDAQGDGVGDAAASTRVVSAAHTDSNESTTQLHEETNRKVRELARIFAEEARRVNEGSPFQAFNTGIHRDVLTRLRPVTEQLASVQKRRRELTEALTQYNQLKAVVEKVERDCARKGKAFVESKRHRKACEKRKVAMEQYQVLRGKFNETYEWLMEMNDHAAAQIIHRYLFLNHEYLVQLNRSITRILPAIQEVYPLNYDYSSIQNSFIVDAIAASAASASAPPLLTDVARPAVVVEALDSGDALCRASNSVGAGMNKVHDTNSNNANNENNTSAVVVAGAVMTHNPHALQAVKTVDTVVDRAGGRTPLSIGKPEHATTRYVDCSSVAITAVTAATDVSSKPAITTELAEKVHEWRKASESGVSGRSDKSNTQAAAVMAAELQPMVQQQQHQQNGSHLVHVQLQSNGLGDVSNFGGLAHMRFVGCSTSVETCSAPMIIHNDNDDVCLVDMTSADLMTAATMSSAQRIRSTDSLDFVERA